MKDSYTRYPRPILWLLREGELTLEATQPGRGTGSTLRVQPFYLSQCPITNEQYEAYDRDHVRFPVSPGNGDPAVGLAYDDAAGYIDWYARISRKPIRLPSEIEWEYACRAGCAGRYFFGDDPALADAYVWDAANSGGRLRPFKDKKPNPFGLYAMLGGVWEWTGSPYTPDPRSAGAEADEAAAEGRRVLRGGSFRTPRDQLGSGVRLAGAPDLCRDDVGFRIARSV